MLYKIIFLGNLVKLFNITNYNDYIPGGYYDILFIALNKFSTFRIISLILCVLTNLQDFRINTETLLHDK